jgi:uncharacterized membrane protein
VISATAHPASLGGWWRQRWSVILLAVSLALNLFFVAGAVWIHLHAPPSPATRFQQMAAELNLDAKQTAAFQEYIRGLRAHADAMRQQTEPTIGAAWAEMAKPQGDQARVMQLFDEATEKRHAMQRDTASQTFAFLATLSPEQRAKFVEIWRERRGPLLRPRSSAR